VPLHVFGLTGGIGSGKSTVAAELRAHGVPVISADELAHRVTEGAAALERIVQAFGAEMLTEEGALDRARLADLVFADAEARERLNAIVHPEVNRLKDLELEALQARGHELAGYDVPLLFEVGIADSLRPVVVVTATAEQQIDRAKRRDSQRPEKIEARMAAQWPLQKKAGLADYVIDNSGSLDETARQVDTLIESLCARFGLDPKRYVRPS
jgi:dephospho-CoA kinase